MPDISFLCFCQVKKLLAQAIVNMAHHGYLELDGGQLMVEFILKQCSLTSDPQVRGAVLYKCFIVYLLSLSSSNTPSPAIRRSEALCSISVLLPIY